MEVVYNSEPDEKKKLPIKYKIESAARVMFEMLLQFMVIIRLTAHAHKKDKNKINRPDITIFQ